MVLSSFAADSLALGAHWMYDVEEIKKLGIVDKLMKGTEYHKTKNTGDFTHYGDQAFVLLQSVSANKGYNEEDFKKRWNELFEGYQGYIDHATQSTLAGYSESDDLAGASRIAPLIFFIHDEEALVEAARAQTAITHNSLDTKAAAKFFARVTYRVLNGMKPIEAMKEVAKMLSSTPIITWVDTALNEAETDSVKAVAGFGQSCHTLHAFPSVVQIIAKYQDDMRQALIQNVMAGGDSAARGMLIGMVLGAYNGDMSEEWRFNKRDEVIKLLS